MSNKFYEILPESGSHVLYENQVPIARYTILAAAEASRAEFIQTEAKRIEARLDQLER